MALNTPQRDWHGLAVWILGASSGIGLALAKALHAQGAVVSVSARNQAALQAFANQHPGSLAVALDITDPQAVARACEQVRQHSGLHWVVHCVGHYQPQSATAFDASEMLRHMNVNYHSAIHLLDAVLPHLLQQGKGHISLVSSVASYKGLPKSLAYGPSKAALSHLAEGLYLDLKPLGLDVSLVSPGFVRTPLTHQNDFQMPALMEPEDAAQAMLDQWGQGVFELHFPKRFTRFMKALRWLPQAWYVALIRRIQ